MFWKLVVIPAEGPGWNFGEECLVRPVLAVKLVCSKRLADLWAGPCVGPNHCKFAKLISFFQLG